MSIDPRHLAYLVLAVVAIVVVFLVVRALYEGARKVSPLTAVAAIGTLVASAGVGHALYAALAPDRPGLHLPALAEAALAALFLDLVVATCAKRARARAADAQVARVDVAVVLLAAVVSGVVSGLHVGWSVAGLFRLAVPVIAALLWLGEVITVLRSRQETDHERALRGVLGAICRRIQADSTEWQWLRDLRIRWADGALVRAMSVYAAADGDRGELARRVNEVHWRRDLLAPLGVSPWQILGAASRALPWPPAGPVPDSSGHLAPDPLLPTVKALVAAVPDIGRPQLMAQLREQGHKVGNDRAAELLRTARTAALNGSGRDA